MQTGRSVRNPTLTTTRLIVRLYAYDPVNTALQPRRAVRVAAAPVCIAVGERRVGTGRTKARWHDNSDAAGSADCRRWIALLSYFNVLVRPAESYRLLTDRNLDGGQSLLPLRESQRSHPQEQILSCSGRVDAAPLGENERVSGTVMRAQPISPLRSWPNHKVTTGCCNMSGSRSATTPSTFSSCRANSFGGGLDLACASARDRVAEMHARSLTRLTPSRA